MHQLMHSGRIARYGFQLGRVPCIKGKQIVAMVRISGRRTFGAHAVLANHDAQTYQNGMFIITKSDADAVRAAFNQAGELSAASELKRRFPAITDNAHVRTCARTIAGWKSSATAPDTVTRLHPGAWRSPGRASIARLR